MLALRFGTGSGEGTRSDAAPELPRDAARAADRARQPRGRRRDGAPARRSRRSQCDVRDHGAPLPALGRPGFSRDSAARDIGQAAPFPRVAALTRLLRWNPLALDIADAHRGDRVRSTVTALARLLEDAGIGARARDSSTRTTCRRSRCSSTGRGRASSPEAAGCSACSRMSRAITSTPLRSRRSHASHGRSGAGGPQALAPGAGAAARAASRCTPWFATPSRAGRSPLPSARLHIT